MKSLRSLILFIVSILLISACNPVSTPGDDQEPIETEPTQTIPSNSIPTSGEANTPLPKPTLAPSSTTTEEVDPAISDTSTCSHPYFPIQTGASWTFSNGSTEAYTLRITEANEDTFSMVQELPNEDAIYTAEWQCSKDGLLRGNFAQIDLLDQTLSEVDEDFNIETLEWEGQTLPNPEAMTLGTTWDSHYRLAGDLNFEGISASPEVNVTITYEIGAIEEVTVPAGTFPDAVRVDSVGNIEISITMGTNAFNFADLDFSSSTWYVRGIGMVKTSDSASGFNEELVLIDSSLLN